jgi:hypothetical protein
MVKDVLWQGFQVQIDDRGREEKLISGGGREKSLCAIAGVLGGAQLQEMSDDADRCSHTCGPPAVLLP